MMPKKVKYVLVLTLLCIGSLSAQNPEEDYDAQDEILNNDDYYTDYPTTVEDPEEPSTINHEEVEVKEEHDPETEPEDLTPEVIPESYPNETAPMQRSGKLIDGEYGENYEDGLFGSDNNNYDSLKSRYAPSEPPSHRPVGSTGGGFVLTETRLREIRSQFLYWFFDKGGNNDLGDYQKDIHTSTPQIHKNFNFQMPFFGFRFNYTRLSMHGYLEFSDPPEHYTYPLNFPIKDWPRRNDPSFIGIFFSKCRIGAIRPTDVDQRAAGVYWRQERDLMTRTDQFGVEVRERVMWDIRQGVVGSDTFIPKHAVFITWKNMSFAGGIDNSLFKTNTFQLVLATDEVYTYAIFNYADLQWSSHTEAGGDTTGGEGGVPAYIGFNAGNGTRSYEYKPYSQESVMRDLTGRGWANGFPGRHIFRIDETIMLGTCNKDIDSAHLPLVFAPESGNMLGGTVVNITGPCFDERVTVRCSFENEVVIGTVIDRNRAICVQPFIPIQGYIRFQIQVGTEAHKWKGQYFVETPATATDRIFFETRDVHEQSPSEIKITWNRFNLTSNLNAGVQISLWGYRERTIRPELQYIDMIEASITNTGEYIIAPNNYRQRENVFTNDMQFGFIQINLTNPEQFSRLRISPILWSKPIPLGWYFGPQWERRFGNQWPRQLCDTWLKTDRYLRNFAAEIPICPCTLEQALNDKGRFLPDFGCDRDSNPTCLYHRGAIHCVRTGLPSQQGAEQQCCYGRDNYLMMSYDQQWGSRPRRSHNLGVHPYNEANKVPTLSTWFHDMIPFYSCCWWQDEQAVGCETFRFERRPTQDCIAYQAPGIAAVFGDPHIITFDNLHYTFNGMGEFVLVRGNTGSHKLEIQGRFERVANNIHGQVHATHLTSVAASANGSVVIEVRVRPRHAQWRYRLDVFANNRRVYFDRPSLKFQNFDGVTVYTPSYILNQSEVVVMFASGAGFEVVENQGFMTARVYLPWTFINKTRGLMGNWSWDPADDFVRPDGTPVSVGNINNFQSIHNDFALHWMLSDRAEEGIGAALFTREFGRTASYYANRTFQPNFIREPVDFLPPNRTQDVIRASELCGESYQCRYDYGMTLNRDMAHFTKNYYDSAVNIRTTNERRIISCGILETPRFGRKSTFLFIPGTIVSYECNQGFVLIGDSRRVCTDVGRWNTPEFGYTECLRAQEYSSRTAGMASGVILAVLVPILLGIICVVYQIIQRRKRDKSEIPDPSYSRVGVPIQMKSAEEFDDYDEFGKNRETELN